MYTTVPTMRPFYHKFVSYKFAPYTWCSTGFEQISIFPAFRVHFKEVFALSLIYQMTRNTQGVKQKVVY